ncbi:PspC domain-containing protein, partial [Dactylosporangium sp. NPDC005572]|uniref:PspC domain-containing protein n=1 Tax=Dactylosporangium sp. NPDC005572 TaxID=3156889 RepID=UPI0033A233D9
MTNPPAADEPAATAAEQPTVDAPAATETRDLAADPVEPVEPVAQTRDLGAEGDDAPVADAPPADAPPADVPPAYAPPADAPAADPAEAPPGAAPPGAVPPPGTPPPAGGGFPPPFGGGFGGFGGGASFNRAGLVRPQQGRYVAGVCAAIGRATNTDPTLWRVIFAVLTLAGGVSIVAYLAGWLLLPAEGDTASPLEALLGRGRSSTSSPLAIVIGISAVLAFVLVMSRNIGAAMVGLAVVIGVVALLVRGQGGSGHPAAAGPFTPPPAPPPTPFPPSVPPFTAPTMQFTAPATGPAPMPPAPPAPPAPHVPPAPPASG